MSVSRKKKMLSVGVQRALKASSVLAAGCVLLVVSGWAVPVVEEHVAAQVQGGAGSEAKSSAESATTGEMPFDFSAADQDPFKVLEQAERYVAALPDAGGNEHSLKASASDEASAEGNQSNSVQSGEHASEPNLFAEANFPEGATAVHWDSEHGVFGFEMDGQASAVLTSLVELWRQQEWESVPLGDLCGATFIKQRGTYRWMVVTCSQIGSVTCIVGKAAA